MFTSLIIPNTAALDEAAEALQRDKCVIFLVDQDGVFLVVTACAEHGVDFVATVRNGDSWAPAPMTLEERERLDQWARTVIPRLCQRWKERYPYSNVGIG